jgi:taurine dioxygenase
MSSKSRLRYPGRQACSFDFEVAAALRHNSIMQVNKIGDAMGAEITGIDLAKALDVADVQAVLDAFHDHQVIAIRNQNLTPGQLVTFSRHLGPLEDQLNARYTLPDYPEVLVLSNDLKDGKPIGLIDGGDFWHSDSSHREKPSMATILHSKQNPQAGGDTQFGNMYRAYEALPAELKERFAGLKAIHAVSKLRNKRVKVSVRRPDAKDHYEMQKAIPDQMWPIVRTHPVTGRKAFYVSERFTIGIEGIAEEEADEILDFLFAHQVKPEFIYTHKWKDGDLVIWDNRCVIHRGAGGYRYPDVRTMHRTVVAGDRPF